MGLLLIASVVFINRDKSRPPLVLTPASFTKPAKVIELETIKEPAVSVPDTIFYSIGLGSSGTNQIPKNWQIKGSDFVEDSFESVCLDEESSK